MKVDLDGIVLNPDGYLPDVNGVYWLLTGITGWDDVAVRATTVQPTSRHGEVTAKAHLEARPMTLTGICKAPNKAAYYEARERLVGHINNIRHLKTMTVTENIDRQVRFRKAADIRMTLAGLAAFEFEIPLTAPDPLKYGPEKQVTIAAGGVTQIVNDGTFVSDRIIMTANSDGVVKVSNAEWGRRGIRCNDAAQSGTIFDFSKREVRSSNGRSMMSVLSARTAWWGLQPGTNTIKNEGAVGVTLAYRDAWL